MRVVCKVGGSSANACERPSKPKHNRQQSCLISLIRNKLTPMHPDRCRGRLHCPGSPGALLLTRSACVHSPPHLLGKHHVQLVLVVAHRQLVVLGGGAKHRQQLLRQTVARGVSKAQVNGGWAGLIQGKSTRGCGETKRHRSQSTLPLLPGVAAATVQTSPPRTPTPTHLHLHVGPQALRKGGHRLVLHVVEGGDAAHGQAAHLPCLLVHLRRHTGAGRSWALCSLENPVKSTVLRRPSRSCRWRMLQS